MSAAARVRDTDMSAAARVRDTDMSAAARVRDTDMSAAARVRDTDMSAAARVRDTDMSAAAAECRPNGVFTFSSGSGRYRPFFWLHSYSTAVTAVYIIYPNRHGNAGVGTIIG